MQVLILEDARATRMILASMMRNLGFEVTEAADGNEGLAQLAHLVKPDLALVDWHMPEMDGPAFVQAVRADRRYSDIRLIMVTAREDQAGAKGVDADAFITKPFTRESLQAKLVQLGLSAA